MDVPSGLEGQESSRLKLKPRLLHLKPNLLKVQLHLLLILELGRLEFMMIDEGSLTW